MSADIQSQLEEMIRKLIQHHGESHICDTCQEAKRLLKKLKEPKP